MTVTLNMAAKGLKSSAHEISAHVEELGGYMLGVCPVLSVDKLEYKSYASNGQDPSMLHTKTDVKVGLAIWKWWLYLEIETTQNEKTPWFGK